MHLPATKRHYYGNLGKSEHANDYNSPFECFVEHSAFQSIHQEVKISRGSETKRITTVISGTHLFIVFSPSISRIMLIYWSRLWGFFIDLHLKQKGLHRENEIATKYINTKWTWNKRNRNEFFRLSSRRRAPNFAWNIRNARRRLHVEHPEPVNLNTCNEIERLVVLLFVSHCFQSSFCPHNIYFYIQLFILNDNISKTAWNFRRFWTKRVEIAWYCKKPLKMLPDAFSGLVRRNIPLFLVLNLFYSL